MFVEHVPKKTRLSVSKGRKSAGKAGEESFENAQFRKQRVRERERE